MRPPKKIYIDDLTGEFDDRWNIYPINDSVEYIHKDVFIEKACEGIEHLLSGYIIRNFHFGDSYETDKFIEDFKNYLKEE